VVDMRTGRDEPGRFRRSLQVHGFPRNGQPTFDFRTDRHKVHELAKRVAEEVVELVPAVIADGFVEKARADADSGAGGFFINRI
jgi:hypothetical protein